MAFDAGMMRAAVWEIGQLAAAGANIEKIYQPQREELTLLLKSGGKTRRVCIYAGSASPRIAVTERSRENPVTAPMFCMLLRKHLNGGRLLSAELCGFDRVARLSFRTYDEMGFETRRHLIAEMMGKYSNLILLDAEDKIISALKIIDFSDSMVRQILPHLPYTLPPVGDRLNPLDYTDEAVRAALRATDGDRLAEKLVTSLFGGVAAVTAREIAYRITGGTDRSVSAASERAWVEGLRRFFDAMKAHDYTPTVVYAADGETPVEYSFTDLTHYASDLPRLRFPSIAAMMDTFFAERDRKERIQRRANDILRILSHAETSLKKKIILRTEELDACRAGETFKREGDLIMANIYRIRRGDDVLLAEDYTADPPETVRVELDPRLSPAANAQKRYKTYTKSKSAKEHLTALIAESQAELAYIATVSAFVGQAECEEDLQEIRSELYRGGYASKMKHYTPPKQIRSRPLSFVSPNGYRVLCGRNNLQNELLTFRTADKGDLWFHAKNVPGSHVILVCGGAEPPEADYTYAAEVAAAYSQATGDLIAVDYTRVKHVKKPQGAKPGFVIYKTNYTAFVTPKRKADLT